MTYRIVFVNKDGQHNWPVPEGKTLSWGVTRVFETNVGDTALVILSIQLIQGKKTTYL